MVDTQPRLQLLQKFTDGAEDPTLKMLIIDDQEGQKTSEESGSMFSFF